MQTFPSHELMDNVDTWNSHAHKSRTDNKATCSCVSDSGRHESDALPVHSSEPNDIQPYLPWLAGDDRAPTHRGVWGRVPADGAHRSAAHQHRRRDARLQARASRERLWNASQQQRLSRRYKRKFRHDGSTWTEKVIEFVSVVIRGRVIEHKFHFPLWFLVSSVPWCGK